MADQRWAQVDRVLQLALDRPPAEREAFVRKAAGSDVALRDELMSLLAHEAAAERFLESSPEGPAAKPRHSWQFPVWPVALLSVPIVLRFAVYAVALFVEPWTPSPRIPAWAQILPVVCFASVSFVLLYYGRQDRRAWVLGLLLLDTAATLLTPFVGRIGSPHPVVAAAYQMRTDAFQAALIWFFAGSFPRPVSSKALGAVFNVATTVAFALGVTLAACDAYVRLFGETSTSFLGSVASVLQRDPTGRSDWYFTLQFLLLLPLLVLMPLKLRESGPNDRRRVTWLALGIFVGYFPLAAGTLLVTFWPQLGQSPLFVRLLVAVSLFALTLVPFAAAYAALVQRTLDVRLVLRQALQYILARSFIWVLAAAPFVALVVVVALNRERSVIDLIAGPTGVVLGLLTAAGVAAAAGRKRLMSLLNRRFFRQETDAKALLLRLADSARRAGSLDELQGALVIAVDSMFHPSVCAIAVAASDDHFHAINTELPPLARGSALALLLAGKNAPVDLVATSPAILDRLSTSELKWLHASRAVVLLPLLDANNELAGVLALGEKRSELPYRAEDHQMLSAIGVQVGAALGRISIGTHKEASAANATAVDAPARECMECGTVFEAAATACACGGLLQRAAAPRTLEDRLRFDRRIGAGGMGVVYLATDLRLHQRRAVKTLPSAEPVLAAGMRREARSMAAVRHPNLATLHGLEMWRGVPMLVMEYAEGGTLAARLRQGPMPLGETLALGICLAEALGALHTRGVLHRDIKPSNIAFAMHGVPKLLDFGLAKLMPRLAPPDGSTEPGEGLSWSESYSSSGAGIRGTPAYLSPEVLRGASPSVRDDLWSLTVTLLEACSGANPFRASTIASTVSRVLAHDPRAAAVPDTLPLQARTLFRELLGPPEIRPDAAQQLASRLRNVHTEGESQ